MATKQPYNQHDYLHPHYGPGNCCLCKEEERVRRLKDAFRTLAAKLKDQKDLDPEISKLVDEHFWELI